MNIKVWQILPYSPTIRSPNPTLLECNFARWSCRDEGGKACSLQHLPPLLQPSWEARASPGVLQHRPNHERMHGLHPWVPSLHLLQGRMSQEASNQQTASDGQRDLSWTQSGRLFTKFRKKAGVREWFTAPYLPVPKLGASSRRSRREGEAAMSEAKSP